MARCKNAISLGWYPELATPPANTPGLHTRCSLDDDGHTQHIGKGLPQFDYQRWNWFTGDRRTYETDRADERAWEV
jgi:hypothetical protein